MQQFAYNVKLNSEKFMTACEDLKQYAEEIQKLKDLEFPSRGILEKLFEKCQKAYDDKVYRLFDIYSKDNGYQCGPWKDVFGDFNISIRDDLKALSGTIDSLNCAHGTLDKYKSEKDEKIADLEGTINSKNAEISGLKVANEKLYKLLDSKDEEINSKNAEIEELKQNLAEKVIAVEHMKHDIINECVERIKGEKMSSLTK